MYHRQLIDSTLNMCQLSVYAFIVIERWQENMDLSVEGWQETEDELRLYVISVSYRLPLLSHSCLRKPEKV